MELLLCACDREAFFVKKLSDAYKRFNVATRIYTLPFCAFRRAYASKLSLPITKHVRFYPNDARDFTDAKVELLRR